MDLVERQILGIIGTISVQIFQSAERKKEKKKDLRALVCTLFMSSVVRSTRSSSRHLQMGHFDVRYASLSFFGWRAGPRDETRANGQHANLFGRPVSGTGTGLSPYLSSCLSLPMYNVSFQVLAGRMGFYFSL